ncbi:MAG: Mov34/MPN/PAD-1 family protein [Dehalococcoidia bacterium]
MKHGSRTSPSSSCPTPANLALSAGRSADRPITELLPITALAHGALLLDLMSRPAESGSILLGPRGGDVITLSVFDAGARCTHSRYEPDHEAINRRMKEEWWPAGLEMKGFCHSHPDGVGRLSSGDLHYIQRIFHAMPKLRWFAAPIVLPQRFRINPFVVTRDPLVVHDVTLEVLDEI